MAEFSDSPSSHFKKAKTDLIDWGKNKITGGNAGLLEAGGEGLIGAYELVEEKIKGYRKRNGTWVRPHSRTVNRKRTQCKRSSYTTQKDKRK